jgi:tricarballylate dehydrogenase
VIGRFIPSVFPAIQAQTVPELAALLGLPADSLISTVDRYNRAVVPGRFDPNSLDSCHTVGLEPRKSHWALPVDKPPFFGYPLRPGITFTYLGVQVNAKAEVQMEDGRAARNIFGAGEIMAGNILGKGYLAGIGMTIGTVFGRIAGKEAARAAAQ